MEYQAAVGHRHRPQLAEEILAPPSSDDVGDPTPAHMQMEPPVTTPTP